MEKKKNIITYNDNSDQTDRFPLYVSEYPATLIIQRVNKCAFEQRNGFLIISINEINEKMFL